MASYPNPPTDSGITMVDALDPDNVAILHGKPGDLERHIQSDYRIRCGLCPNGCGLMLPCDYGQECPGCQFSCNIPHELTQQ